MGERKKEGSLDQEKGKRRGGIFPCPPHTFRPVSSLPRSLFFLQVLLLKRAWEKEGKHLEGFLSSGWLVSPMSLRTRMSIS